jgi:hypothetical protein
LERIPGVLLYVEEDAAERLRDSWYSLINCGACTSLVLTHELSEDGYPFHLIRYWCLRLRPCLQSEMISSTSYSSLPSIRSGGGCGNASPYAFGPMILFAAANQVPFILVNQRDYAGSMPLSDAELAELGSLDLETHAKALV